jgi:hypothetical protein
MPHDGPVWPKRVEFTWKHRLGGVLTNNLRSGIEDRILCVCVCLSSAYIAELCIYCCPCTGAHLFQNRPLSRYLNSETFSIYCMMLCYDTVVNFGFVAW